jgi:hypothetical protein
LFFICSKNYLNKSISITRCTHLGNLPHKMLLLQNNTCAALQQN